MNIVTRSTLARTLARSAAATAVLALVLMLGHGRPCRAADAPDVDAVLKRIDGAVLFHDAQDGLKGYQVELLTGNGMAMGGKDSPPDAKNLKPAATLAFDAAKGRKTQRDKDGQDEAPGSFTPMCGPWTLTALVGFEVDLFATPFGKRFTEEKWDRECSAEGDGCKLTLTPKEPIGEAFMLKPAIPGIECDVDKDGVPTGATLHLDQQMMHDDGMVKFVFADEQGKKRIQRIENELKSANLGVSPVLTFKFAKVSTWTLPESVEFRVAGAELSGTMRGMEMLTTMLYKNYVMTK